VPVVAEVDQGALDAVDALAHGHFRQTDQHRLGQPGRHVHLGFDRSGVDADQGKRVQLGEHTATPGVDGLFPECCMATLSGLQ
jgi:hypothetical protein